VLRELYLLEKQHARERERERETGDEGRVREVAYLCGSRMVYICQRCLLYAILRNVQHLYARIRRRNCAHSVELFAGGSEAVPEEPK
jgi:hypothetical protein